MRDRKCIEDHRRSDAETPSSTREFEKLGIYYCCGGSRILGEACAAANIPIEEALSRLEKT